MLAWFDKHHQILTAIGALLVGLAALFVAWDQARVMRSQQEVMLAQQHGSVMPAIQIDSFIMTTPDTMSVGLRVHNNGVGPAFVRSVEMQRNDEARDSFDELTVFLPDGVNRSWSSMTGRIMAPGDSLEPITISWARDAILPQDLRGLVDEWALWNTRVCYCSVFERCWIADAGAGAPERVEQCDIPADDIFETLGTAAQRAG